MLFLEDNSFHNLILEYTNQNFYQENQYQLYLILNQSTYFQCNNYNFHGHNYKLEVWIDGPIDPETGYVIDLKILKGIINEEVIERFDHRNLNEDCPEFQNLIPTAEHISMVCYDLLKDKLDKKFGLCVKLWETENNVVVYEGK